MSYILYDMACLITHLIYIKGCRFMIARVIIFDMWFALILSYMSSLQPHDLPNFSSDMWLACEYGYSYMVTVIWFLMIHMISRFLIWHVIRMWIYNVYIFINYSFASICQAIYISSITWFFSPFMWFAQWLNLITSINHTHGFSPHSLSIYKLW